MAYLPGLPRALRIALRCESELPLSIPVAWVAALAFVGFLSGVLYYAQSRIERLQREQTVVVAQLAADRVASALDDGDRLLKELSGELPVGAAPPARLQAPLARSLARHASVMAETVVDVHGQVLAHSAGKGNDSWSDRDLPAAATMRRAATTVLAIAQYGASGTWRARLARRLDDPAGEPIGMLVAEIDLGEAFVRLVQSPAFEQGDVIALRNTADGVLASYPIQAASKYPLGEFPIQGAVAAEIQSGVYYSQSAQDHVRRLVAYHGVAGYPVYVAYGKNVDRLFADWRHEAIALTVAALAALATTLIVTAGIRRRVVLARQLEEMRHHLQESNNALRVALAASELVAARDQLTGLWNRRSFDQRMQESIAHLARHEGTLSLLMIDIDYFKSINDQYGHLTGDEVLKWFADVLQERLRQNDVNARWGGEEFVVLADGADLDNAHRLAEQIRETVATCRFGSLPRITVSIGVAEFRRGETNDDLLLRADEALYEAKRAGRNRVVAADKGPTLRVGDSLFDEADCPPQPFKSAA